MGKKDDFVRLSRENAKVNATFPENNQKCLTKMLDKNAGGGYNYSVFYTKFKIRTKERVMKKVKIFVAALAAAVVAISFLQSRSRRAEKSARQVTVTANGL